MSLGNTMPDVYKFFRKETGEYKDVALEKWRWIALYDDGSVFYQFNPDTLVFHQLKEIDQSRLAEFRMVSDKYPTGISLRFQSNFKLIHFYRQTRLNVLTPDEKRLKWYYFGYEVVIDERVHKLLCRIDHEDRVSIGDGQLMWYLNIKPDGLVIS